MSELTEQLQNQATKMDAEPNSTCERLGHDWSYYAYATPPFYSSTDIEQAGLCKRCGYDTHS